MEARPIEGLPPLPIDNTNWSEWANDVMAHRIRVDDETRQKWRGQRAAQEREIQRIRRDGRYWLATYGSIYAARPEEDEMPTSLDEDWSDSGDAANGWVEPFIPYTFQLYYWDFQQRAFRTKGSKGDVAVVKSRQMGMSYMACALFAHLWMVRKPFQGRLLSRKEDLVDESNNPDSLFWKIRLLLQSQPKWIMERLAPGFSWVRDSMLASITNPENFNHLHGESTNATAGRGGAATAMLLDEYAFMRGGAGIWTATRAATRHRIAISTVSLKLGTHFYDLIHPEDGVGPAVLVVPHYLHPDHTDIWVENEKARDTDAGFRQEVLMDWYADESDFVYPQFSEVETGNFPYLPFMGPVGIAIDDGFSGYWAMHVVQYVPHLGRHRVVESYRNSHKVTDFYGSLLRGIYLADFQYGDEEHNWIRLMHMINDVRFIMDTHGRNLEQVSGESVIIRLANRWGINANLDNFNRSYQSRNDLLDELSPTLDWNDTPGVRRALKSCQLYKWKVPDENSTITTVQKEPVKNKDSHDPTAMEYYAADWATYKYVYLSGGQFVQDGEDAF